MDAETEAQLQADRAVWEQAVALVLADITTTTPLRWSMQVNAEENSTVLEVPELWLETRSGRGWWESTLLHPSDVELDDAVFFIADKAQEEVIEELQITWPQCPHHSHPLDARGQAWVCPSTGQRVVDVGSLDQLSAAS